MGGCRECTASFGGLNVGEGQLLEGETADHQPWALLKARLHFGLLPISFLVVEERDRFEKQEENENRSIWKASR